MAVIDGIKNKTSRTTGGTSKNKLYYLPPDEDRTIAKTFPRSRDFLETVSTKSLEKEDGKHTTKK